MKAFKAKFWAVTTIFCLQFWAVCYVYWIRRSFRILPPIYSIQWALRYFNELEYNRILILNYIFPNCSFTLSLTFKLSLIWRVVSLIVALLIIRTVTAQSVHLFVKFNLLALLFPFFRLTAWIILIIITFLIIIRKLFIKFCYLFS